MAEMRRRSLTRKMRKRRLYRHQTPSMRLKRSFKKYFNSGWIPGAVCFGLLSGALAAIAPSTLWTLPALINWLTNAIATLFLVALPVAFSILVGSTIWNLAKKRWWRGGLSCTLLFLFLGSLTGSAVQLLLFVKADGI
ncbi:MAG: hypothetical protein AAGC93_02280 [Cyanobacteria bacterium P01_F01_bin.53]